LCPSRNYAADEQQAAQELRQWQTRSVVEKCKVIDATPVATLAMLMTPGATPSHVGLHAPLVVFRVPFPYTCIPVYL
jgi:hypothetical protein